MDPIVVTTTQARWAPPDVAQPSFPSAQPAPSNRFHLSRASLPLSPARLETNKRLVQVRHAYAHGPENAVQRSTLGDLSGLSLFLSLSLSLYTPPADAYAVTPRGKVPSHRVRRIRSRHACTTYRDRETCMPCSFFLLFFFLPLFLLLPPLFASPPFSYTCMSRSPPQNKTGKGERIQGRVRSFEPPVKENATAMRCSAARGKKGDGMLCNVPCLYLGNLPYLTLPCSMRTGGGEKKKRVGYTSTAQRQHDTRTKGHSCAISYGRRSSFLDRSRDACRRGSKNLLV